VKPGGNAILEKSTLRNGESEAGIIFGNDIGGLLELLSEVIID
jgi:hypothetical protein